MITLLWILLGVVIVLPLLRLFAFLLSNHLRGDLGEIRQRLGGLGWALVRAYATALVAEPLAVLGSARMLLKSREGGEGTPVLLVHGLFHNRTAWWFFRQWFRHAGYTNLHTYQYNSFTRDFETAMRGMEQKLDELLGDNPDARVVLVGHSLGGLVCRTAAGMYRFRERVAALVTLGSPHGGSDLAALGGNRMARDLMPGRYISKRVEETPDPDCPRLGIYTLTDDYVFPLSTLRTGRPGWTEVICSPMGHVWMIYSREVFDLVANYLLENEITP